MNTTLLGVGTLLLFFCFVLTAFISSRLIWTGGVTSRDPTESSESRTIRKIICTSFYTVSFIMAAIMAVLGLVLLSIGIED